MGYALSLKLGPALGLTLCFTLCIALGLALGLTLGLKLGLTLCLSVGLTLGLTLCLTMGLCLCLVCWHMHRLRLGLGDGLRLNPPRHWRGGRRLRMARRDRLAHAVGAAAAIRQIHPYRRGRH